MTHYEVYVLCICLIVFVMLFTILVSFLTVIVKQLIRMIRHGLEDEKIIIEYSKEKNRKITLAERISKVFSIVFIAALFVTYAFSIFTKAQENDKVGMIPALRVVRSGSMSEKHKDNKHLFDNKLDNQMQVYDMVVIHKLPDEFDLELYDVVVYQVDDIYVIHRIVGIEEPNEKHPNERYFLLQGDAIDQTDRFPVKYEQMIGIYEDQRIPFIGSFVLFLQSYAGFLCIGLIIFALVVTPIVEKKIEKEKLARLRLLNVITDEEYEEKEENTLLNKFGFNKNNKTFVQRLIESDDEIHRLYNEVKNYLMKYDCKSRYFNKCETFRNRGIIARITLLGKALKVYLAIEPSLLKDKKYNIKDVSSIKKYANVPTMLRVRSNRSLRYYKEIVDMIMLNKNIKANEDYQFEDFIKLLEIIEAENKVIEEQEEIKEEQIEDKPLDISMFTRLFEHSDSIRIKLKRVDKKGTKKINAKILDNKETVKNIIDKYDITESSLSRITKLFDGKTTIYIKLKRIDKDKK